MNKITFVLNTTQDIKYEKAILEIKNKLEEIMEYLPIDYTPYKYIIKENISYKTYVNEEREYISVEFYYGKIENIEDTLKHDITDITFFTPNDSFSIETINENGISLAILDIKKCFDIIYKNIINEHKKYKKEQMLREIEQNKIKIQNIQERNKRLEELTK